MNFFQHSCEHAFPVFIIFVTYLISESKQGDDPVPVPYALSPVYLQYLENFENQFYNLLKNSNELNHENGDPKRREIIERYLEDYERSTRNLSTTPSENSRGLSNEYYQISSNPILSLQMINRYVKYFKKGLLISSENNDNDIFPSDKDVEDAMEAFLRLQYVYDIDATQLADGIVDGPQQFGQLSALECYELGKFAQESAYFTLALQWFNVALQKLQRDNSTTSKGASPGLKENVILKAIRDTIEEHNEDYDENIAEGDMYSFSTPIYNTNYSAIAHLSLRKRLPIELTGKVLPEKDPRFFQAVESNMMALCAGQNLQSEKEKAKLNCWLDTKRHPYWTINPLKIQLLNSNPPIIQLFDLFNDRWINYLKNMSHAVLYRAPESAEATPRTAAYAWFEDNEIPEAPVSKIVEFITGLNVEGPEASEALQVAAYAFGGHVEAHYDSKGPDDPDPNPRGDRVTTFLVYLSEVEKGGFTAFPLLGVSIKPVKNSAVLWYTNLRNGEVDPNTLHAACPVITGHKWIATKWTHIKENILKRPCGLSPEE